VLIGPSLKIFFLRVSKKSIFFADINSGEKVGKEYPKMLTHPVL
jgi:hypothetical protein